MFRDMPNPGMRAENGCGAAQGAALVLVVLLAWAVGPWLAAAAAADYGTQHLEVPAAGSPRSSPQPVRLGLNKSLVIDLPRPAKDVLVSNPKKADAVMRTPRRAYVIGMEVGQTNIFFFDEAGQQIVALDLVVEQDVAALNAMFRKLVPGANISVDAINENVVLSGTAPSPADAGRAADIAGRFAGDAKKVLNMIAVEGSDQIYLKVTVGEIQRNATKQLGVDWNAQNLDIGNVLVSAATNLPYPVAGAAPDAFLKGAFTDNFLTNEAGSGATDDAVWAQRQLGVTIKALEQTGIFRTLAEPTLTAISGESASFLAGGEFPVVTGVDPDTKTPTVEFKPFGVSLAFTPVVLSEGRISLKIKTEVSELTNEGAVAIAGQTVPGLKVRRAETTVELPSGGSLVMAGLLQENAKHAISGLPGAKDMPVLGALFRSRDFQNNETEMVVIVTPYTVNPANRRDLALPTSNFQPASDVSADLMGRLNELYGVRGSTPAGTYQGEYGFIIK